MTEELHHAVCHDCAESQDHSHELLTRRATKAAKWLDLHESAGHKINTEIIRVKEP